MKIEVLEPRQLLASTSASISGTVFYDTDASQNQDTREPGLSGWTVYIDTNANGQFDAGEPTSVTNSKGRYSFAKVPAGDYLIGVVNQNSDYQSTPSVTGAVQGRFRIALNLAAGMTASERTAFVTAAERWESIINAMPTSVDPRATQQTLTIDAKIGAIDGVDGILGESAPTKFRYDDNLPIKGSMQFDRADLSTLEDGGGLYDVILHEMGHVLGFGTIWDSFSGLLTSTHNHKPRFNGTNAEAAYKALFGAADTTGYVPVEGEGGDGTANGHWSEAIFKEELMTGYVNGASTLPLSTLTVAQFADLGYTVNMNAADDWNPTRGRTIRTTALDLGAKAYERKVTVAVGDAAVGVDFGYRASETAPTFKANAVPATGVAGDIVTLNAAGVVDAENDALAGITFYQESNGIAGLQTGTNGDTYVGMRTVSKKGIFSITAPSDPNSSSQTYYARAVDSVGYGRTRAIAVKLTADESVASYTAPAHAFTATAAPSSSLAQAFGLTSTDLLI